MLIGSPYEIRLIGGLIVELLVLVEVLMDEALSFSKYFIEMIHFSMVI